LGERDERAPYVHWPLAFPEVMCGQGGFDVVIGNPPWISFGLRGAARLPEAEARYYRRTYPEAAEYKVSSYALFMALAARLTRPGGRHCLIVPDSFVVGARFTGVRRLLHKAHTLEHMTLIGGEMSSQASVGQSIV